MYSVKKLFLIFVLGLLVVIIYSCKPKVVKQKPTADYLINNRQVKAGDTVRFTYESNNYDKLLWDFGDGSNSEEKNPVHVYYKEGSFYINFTVIKGSDTAANADLKIFVLPSNVVIGRPDSLMTFKKVPVKKDSDRNVFTATLVIWPTTVYTGEKIGYTARSDKPFTIDFGGKSTSDAKAGEITFNEIGQYVIKMTDKATGTLLDKKTVTILERVDDGKFSSWLTDMANDKLSRIEKTALSIKVYGNCMNNGEIPVDGKETGSFKDFVRKIMFEANPYETVSITVNILVNKNKKISGVKLVTYDKKAI